MEETGLLIFILPLWGLAAVDIFGRIWVDLSVLVIADNNYQILGSMQ